MRALGGAAHVSIQWQNIQGDFVDSPHELNMTTAPRVPRSIRSKATIAESSRLELVQEGEYMLQTYFERRDGSKFEMRPDGRQCRLCKRKDTGWCPLALAKMLKRYIDWERAPKADGTTDGFRYPNTTFGGHGSFWGIGQCKCTCTM